MGVRAVDDLTRMSGQWVLCATSVGYFDRRPRVDAATLEYTTLSPRSVAFVVRFRIGSRVHALRGRQSRTRSADGLFRFRGWGSFLQVTRIRWDLAMEDSGEVVVAANAGSLISPPGVLLFARPDAPRAELRRRVESDPRAFGFTRSQVRTFFWRAENATI